MGRNEVTVTDILPAVEQRSEDDLETLQKQAARLKAYYKYRNDYNKTHYERINVLVPPGTKDRIRAVTDISLSSFIYDCIERELQRLEAQKQESGQA